MRGALSIHGAVKVYDPDRSMVVALDGLDLDIAPGEFCSVVGPSGCGKTTLLNAIAGFDTLTAGSITLDGQRIAEPDRSAPPGADRIVVFQNGALFPWRSVLWNVTCGPVMQKRMGRAEATERARALLARVGMQGSDDKYPGELSGGQRRRVEIVRALMNDPKVLLLDEPYRALDSLTKSVMHEALLEIYYKNKVTIFFITHDLEEAIFLGHRVAIMTTRPCKPKKVLSVDIPHPRDYSVLTSKRFRELIEETNEAVHEEALKAFQAGEKEG
jgi:NitT/TauT family transport system ATP-binding protein